MGPALPGSASAVATDPTALAMVATFVPPADAPSPIPRPDFGDRVAEAQNGPVTTVAMATMIPTAEDHGASPFGDNGALSFAPSLATGRTLVAYQDATEAEEHEDDDRPLEPGPLQEGQRWRAAWGYVKTDCFPEDLKKAMNVIAAHFNSDVLVASGFRGNGRRHSMHRSCRAADIRVLGVAPSSLAAFAKTVPSINGVGTYRRNSLTHIDVRAAKFAWRY
jgi:uncharacterized protein YcbK (DUF882 family)